MKTRKKILIALSGGVDSAVSAALLKKQGFDIFGVYFRFFKNPPKSPFNKGGAKKKVEQDQALSKAKKVAKALNISLEIVDARREFKKKVVDYFIDSYKKGITPNPCVVCNKEMKFRLLFELMKKYGADHVSTGHYARIEPVIARSPSKGWINSATWQSRAMQSGSGLLRSARNDNYKLLEAKDKSKDQSYFLYKLNQRELAKIIFPLGDYTKVEVRKIAKKIKLPIFDVEESQDVCFLAGNDINQFLRKYIKPKPGNIVDEKGNILARHKGLPFYTIGQRKGIEIGGTGPYFVIGKDSKKNQLVVSNDPKKLLVKKLMINQVNWVDKGIKFPLRAKVQIRYHAPKVSVIIREMGSGGLEVRSEKPLRAVTPGQSAVFYKNREVLGGGIIV